MPALADRARRTFRTGVLLPGQTCVGKIMRKVAMEVPKGLEGVEVDVTKISLVDGEQGRLSYRGRDVTRLIEWPFSRVVLLVLTGDDPSAAECRAFETALLRASRLSADDAGLLTLAAKTRAHPMAV